MPGTAPLLPRPEVPRRRARPQSRLQHAADQQPVSLKDLAVDWPKHAWRTVTWRTVTWRTVTWRAGSQGALSSRLAARRVRPAHRDTLRSEPWPQEWLPIEWPKGEAEPTKYWLSNLPPTTPLKRLVHTAKGRWVIERDEQGLKQEIGLGHYEGRNGRGFHHHASLCMAAYGFLVAERCLFPPQHRLARERLTTPALPRGFAVRGAAHPA